MSAWTHEDAGAPAKRPPHRVGHKVRRRSAPKEWAATFCQKVRDHMVTPMLRAIRYYAMRLERPKHCSAGELTESYLKVYRALVDLAVLSTDGQLCPSYGDIAKKARVSRSTVRRALNMLERHSFVERLRRCELADDGPKKRWKQAENAYRVLTPPAAKKLLDGPHVEFDRKAVPPRLPPQPRRLPPLSKAMAFANRILPVLDHIQATLANDHCDVHFEPEP
jgi:predicted transcriptional regulator